VKLKPAFSMSSLCTFVFPLGFSFLKMRLFFRKVLFTFRTSFVLSLLSLLL